MCPSPPDPQQWCLPSFPLHYPSVLSPSAHCSLSVPGSPSPTPAPRQWSLRSPPPLGSGLSPPHRCPSAQPTVPLSPPPAAVVSPSPLPPAVPWSRPAPHRSAAGAAGAPAPPARLAPTATLGQGPATVGASWSGRGSLLHRPPARSLTSGRKKLGAPPAPRPLAPRRARRPAGPAPGSAAAARGALWVRTRPPCWAAGAGGEAWRGLVLRSGRGDSPPSGRSLRVRCDGIGPCVQHSFYQRRFSLGASSPRLPYRSPGGGTGGPSPREGRGFVSPQSLVRVIPALSGSQLSHPLTHSGVSYIVCSSPLSTRELLQ